MSICMDYTDLSERREINETNGRRGGRQTVTKYLNANFRNEATIAPCDMRAWRSAAKEAFGRALRRRPFECVVTRLERAKSAKTKPMLIRADYAGLSERCEISESGGRHRARVTRSEPAKSA